MAKIEKARAEMFDDICSFFTAGMAADQAKALADKFYRPIFACPWEREEDYFGHVLVDRGSIVGFVGAFFAQRRIGGATRRFCNLTTWKVREEYRSESILLIMPFLRMKGHTVTGRTAAWNIFAIHQKLGFRYLDDRVIVTPAFTGRENLAAAASFSSRDDLFGLLSAEDQRLVRDHDHYKCHPLVLHRNGKTLLVMVTVPRKWGVRVAYVQYISDVDLFKELLPQVRSELLRQLRTPFLWIEKRLLHGRNIPWSYEYRSPYVHLYKSDDLIPEQIDNLYTEIVVFNTLENRFY